MEDASRVRLLEGLLQAAHVNTLRFRAAMADRCVCVGRCGCECVCVGGWVSGGVGG
jgi:hypothetical protein